MTRRQNTGVLPVHKRHRLRKTAAVQGALQEQRSHAAACTPTRILPGQRLAHLAGSLRFAAMTAERLDPSSPLAITYNWGSESARPLTSRQTVVLCWSSGVHTWLEEYGWQQQYNSMT